MPRHPEDAASLGGCSGSSFWQGHGYTRRAPVCGDIGDQLRVGLGEPGGTWERKEGFEGKLMSEA